MVSKHLIITLIFIFLILIQTSLLPNFNIQINLVFIFFFNLVFFSASRRSILKHRAFLGPEDFFRAIIAGFLVDVFSEVLLGISIILFLGIDFLTKKTISLLQEKPDRFPLVYFISIFIVSLLGYNAVLSLVQTRSVNVDLKYLIYLAYNMVFATTGFYVFKKFFNAKYDSKQLKLFR